MRDALDRYYTPPWCVRQCLDVVLPAVIKEPKTILEPSAGAGAFIDPLRMRFPSAEIVAMDLDEGVGPWKGADESLHGNFLDSGDVLSGLLSARKHPHFDLVIGNPPYDQAFEFVDQAISIAENVAFLVRSSFLSSCRRTKFFRDECRPTHVFLLAHRPSFTGHGSDYAEYCWVCWSMRKPKKTYLTWLPEVSAEERGLMESRQRKSTPKAV